ncbi:D-cysteine desulfhydrase family protein [Acidobacteriota bacterium]
MVTLDQLKKKIAFIPKKDMIHLPTPFRKLENLTRELGGPEIYIKRDDLTGLAFGGNKSRKLQFIIQDILEKKCDVVITWAGLQSNWCLQTAATARRFGIAPILILFKTYDLPEEYDGNLLLDYILDAEIKIVEAERGKLVKPGFADAYVEEQMEKARGKGYSPYYAPLGGSYTAGSMDKPLGAIGYVEGFVEAYEQSAAYDFEMDYIIHATGSGGTQAGFIVGAKALGSGSKVYGISVSEGKEDFTQFVHSICLDTEQSLGLDANTTVNDVYVFDEYLQEGYGIVTKEVAEILRLLAIKEGIFLDPVYTGKAMYALVDMVKKGHFQSSDKILFYHTGGTAALFPNKNILTGFLPR